MNQKLNIRGKRSLLITFEGNTLAIKAAMKVRNSQENLDTFVWEIKSAILRLTFTYVCSSSLIQEIDCWVYFPCNR